MTRQTTVKVVIYGTEFAFKTDDPEYIRELARFVDEQIQKIASAGRLASPTKAITLAAFNIADELFRVRREKEEISNTLSQRLDAMIKMADEAYRPTDASG